MRPLLIRKFWHGENRVKHIWIRKREYSHWGFMRTGFLRSFHFGWFSVEW